MDKPVFIGGFRSGTTLLVNLLGMHDALAPWFETKCLVEALRWLRVRREPQEETLQSAWCNPPEPAGFSPDAVLARMQAQMRETFARLDGARESGKAAHERYPIGHDCLCHSPEEGLRALEEWRAAVGEGSDYDCNCAATGDLIRRLGAAHAGAFGAPHWLNKTPEIPRFARELRDCLGPTRVIYMLRNGMEVVASASKLGWGRTEQLAFNWKGLLETTRDGMRGHEADYLELRFEDLLAQPAATLDRVFRFCVLPEQGETIVAAFERDFGPAAFARASERGASLPAEQLAVFRRVAGDLQAALGYPL